MCGIIGITNKTEAAAAGITFGLKALEYRGYDSAGSIFTQNFEIYKTIQSLEVLDKMIKHQAGTTALGHTRWATHGKICIENTHPIKIGDAAIAHNGILENHIEIRNQINYTPQTGTDTEILLALMLHINRLQFGSDRSNEGILKTLSETKKAAHGSFSAAFVFAQSDTIYWIRNGIVPLIAAEYDGGNAIASDECALNKNAIIFELNNDAYGYISPNKIEILSETETKQHAINISDTYTKEASKSWLEIEIEQQSEIYERESKKEPIDLKLGQYDSVLLIGCGSAYIAATIGKLWLEEEGIKANAEIASEWHCRKSAESKNTLVILISQSGETADTLLALEKAQKMGLSTLAIVNKENSTIAKQADRKILLEIGTEQSVASTKAFTSQLAKLFSIAKKAPISNRLHDLAYQATKMDISNISSTLSNAQAIMIIGKNAMYSIALEGALKLKELTYMNVDAYASSELKHGYIALVDENTYAIGLAPSNNNYQTVLSNISEIKTRHGKILLLAEKNDIEAEMFLQMPKMDEHEAAFTYIIIIQRLALEIAHKKHLPIDRPRNLAKSITVI